MDHWFIHHAAKLPQLTSEQRQLIGYLTGRIPLLLRPLFDQENFNEQRSLDHKDLKKVNVEVIHFFIQKQTELSGDPIKKEM
jgi:hypothetical protein